MRERRGGDREERWREVESERGDGEIRRDRREEAITRCQSPKDVFRHVA